MISLYIKNSNFAQLNHLPLCIKDQTFEPKEVLWDRDNIFKVQFQCVYNTYCALMQLKRLTLRFHHILNHCKCLKSYLTSSLPLLSLHFLFVIISDYYVHWSIVVMWRWLLWNCCSFLVLGCRISSDCISHLSSHPLRTLSW